MRHEDLCVLKKVCPLCYFSARVTSPIPVASGRACKLLHTLQWCLHIHSVRWPPIVALFAFRSQCCSLLLPAELSSRLVRSVQAAAHNQHLPHHSVSQPLLCFTQRLSAALCCCSLDVERTGNQLRCAAHAADCARACHVLQ